MPTNQAQLNLGQPDLGIDPNNPQPPDQATQDEALRFGNALGGIWGTTATPTSYGDYVRRIPVAVTGVAVATNTCTTATPGGVLSVQVTAGAATGPVAIMVTGTPSAGQCRVDYNANGTATITFAAADAVTACAYHQLQVPAAIIAHLDSNTDPA